MNKADGQDNHSGDNKGTMTEYFCIKCLQLRLSLVIDKSHCQNCGSTDIVTGSVGSLDKADLVEFYAPDGN